MLWLTPLLAVRKHVRSIRGEVEAVDLVSIHVENEALVRVHSNLQNGLRGVLVRESNVANVIAGGSRRREVSRVVLGPGLRVYRPRHVGGSSVGILPRGH